ncbi:MAG: hypothetical protein C0501_01045 [Isosphaera sp.]|nr:hypothetical protein [Isosphaera sp.]
MNWYVLLLVLNGTPPAPVLDYSGLPPANTVPGYSLTITIGLDGLPPEVVKCGIGAAANPEDVANALTNSLEDHPWVMERDGLKITLRSLGKARVTNVTVVSTGPSPVVRWTFAPLPKKQ